MIRPRIVDARRRLYTQIGPVIFLSGGDVPVILQVNRESRIEGLKKYTRIYNQMPLKHMYSVNLSLLTKDCFYFNFNMDTICIGNRRGGGTLSLSQLGRYLLTGPAGNLAARIQSLGVHHGSFFPSTSYPQSVLRETLLKFTGLRNITVVVDDMRGKEAGRLEFIEPKIWEGEREHVAFGHDRKYCTKEQAEDRVRNVQESLDKIKAEKPDWSQPTVRGMSLIKNRRRQWLG